MKDHYEILQVHPKAERIVIEAAFRRLAREYHPDVYKGSDAHAKMIAINEAWEVLGDPESRAEYDRTRSPRQTSSPKEPAEPRSEPAAPRTETYTESPRRPSPQAPTPPNPADFDIWPNYLDIATEGASAWKKRKKLLPEWLQAVITMVFLGAGILVSVFASAPELAPIKDVAGFGWIAGLALGWASSAGVQALHDKIMLRDQFGPRYNPRPEDYARYAAEFAKYETEACEVFITRTGSCFHAHSWCGSSYSMAPIPKYEAIAYGYRPCSHCGYFSVRVRDLPPPFGNGRLPDVEELEKATTKEIESHAAEIRDLILKRVWDKAKVDLKVPWKENLAAIGRIDYHAKRASKEMVAAGKAHVEIPNLISKPGQKPFSIDLTVRLHDVK